MEQNNQTTAIQGANCGTTDGLNHSPECIVEAAACQGWLNTPEAVDALLKVMVNRFLGWKLPQDFGPDCYVSFDRDTAEKNGWPSGTNLLHAGQALEMFKHCLPAELIAPTQAEQDHQCCVKCEKPEADATDPLQPTPEEYQAAISELVTRLRQADAVIVSLFSPSAPCRCRSRWCSDPRRCASAGAGGVADHLTYLTRGDALAAILARSSA